MAGYNELAYLHPNRFTPDRRVLEKLNVKEEDKYVVIRFIAFNGSHDIDITGLSFDNKMKAIKEFSKYAKVFISSEKELPPPIGKIQASYRPQPNSSCNGFFESGFWRKRHNG